MIIAIFCTHKFYYNQVLEYIIFNLLTGHEIHNVQVDKEKVEKPVAAESQGNYWQTNH